MANRRQNLTRLIDSSTHDADSHTTTQKIPRKKPLPIGERRDLERQRCRLSVGDLLVQAMFGRED